MIRYRTRDLTRLLPPTARSMRRMGKIVGRSDDMLIIRGVNVFPTQIEELVLKHGQLSGQYQLVVTREGNLDDVNRNNQKLWDGAKKLGLIEQFTQRYPKNPATAWAYQHLQESAFQAGESDSASNGPVTL